MYEKLKAAGLSFVDVTCPFVLKIHRIVRAGKQSRKTDHNIRWSVDPEVKGICGWCEGSCTVLRSREETEDFVATDENPLRCFADDI